MPIALTIAGSDSGGGAGVQADLKTFTAYNVYGMSVITSITAQNTQSVAGIHDLPPEFVELQIESVVEDIGVDAVKTGMLSNKGIIASVAKKLTQYKIEKIVIDPVMRAKSGDVLLRSDAEFTLINELLPLAYLVTPNLPEAEAISGYKISSANEMKEAAEKIKSLGSQNVLIKGGHLDWSKDAIDILFDGDEFYQFSSPRIDTKNTHGTGCTYSAAICAGLAKGYDLQEAVKDAKEFVTQAIRESFDLGKGHGPLNHFWKSQ
ncbi:MAG: bifunctional hydroxymethylpyrimidine kinase/phosphomethylpyrimidine kinase [Deltaproteobacteria bacterium]|nr:bifunctional hydroxymethylpyrimidine kinase/phosphomethylpyrimidine kinase [Deltaproteobacteria bacterium]